MRGVFEFDYEGKRQGFYFNFNALGILEEQMNIPIDEIIEQLNDDNGKGRLKMKILLNFFHAGAVNYYEAKKRDIDFTIHDVGDWISEVGLDQAGKFLREALSSSTPKNLSPLPTTEGNQSPGE